MDAEEVKGQIIWYNSLIKQGGRVLPVHSALFQAGLRKIGDIVKNDNTYFSAQEFINKFTNKQGAWFWYCKLLASLPTVWKIIIQGNESAGRNRVNTETLKAQNASKVIYDSLLDKQHKETDLLKYAVKWCKALEMETDLEWYTQLFAKIYKITKSVKLRDFQY